MGQRMCNTTSVTDHIQSLIAAFQILIDLYFHIVEFYLHTIEKGIVICCTRCYLIQSIDHLNDSIHDSLWKNQTQITRRC